MVFFIFIVWETQPHKGKSSPHSWVRSPTLETLQAMEFELPTGTADKGCPSGIPEWERDYGAGVEGLILLRITGA